MIFGGLVLLGLSAILGIVPFVGGIFGALGLVVGVIFLVIGMINFVVTYWLWKLEKRGWMWVTVFNIIAIIFALASFNFVEIIIPLIVAIYLWTKKDIFK